MLTKADLIYNALLIGMALPDAFMYAACTENEILEYSEEPYASRWATVQKQVEYGLLEKLNTVIDKQMNRGDAGALTWLLQRLNPRYTDKPQSTLPEIHMHLDPSDPATYDAVTIHNASVEAEVKEGEQDD